MGNTKEDYKDLGVIKKISPNGLGIYMEGKGANKTEQRVIGRCKIGDRVVMNKQKDVLIIPEDEWTDMPSSKEELIQQQIEEDPALEALKKEIELQNKKIEALEGEMKELKEKLKVFDGDKVETKTQKSLMGEANIKGKK